MEVKNTITNIDPGIFGISIYTIQTLKDFGAAPKAGLVFTLPGLAHFGLILKSS